MSAVKFAIIGCGLIGRKRLAGLPADSLAVACDLDIARAESLVHAAKCGRATQDFHDAVSDPAVNAVIVSTLNGTLAEISLAALRAGKHVLVEKPGALTAQQMEPLVAEAISRKLCVRIGYNHRFHPAFQKAREIFDSGALGELMFIRGRYGHGGRIGYDREWRANPELSGGGELIDQGVHLIDLARWFLGDFATVEGHTATFFWDMPVDDNAFLSLRTATGQTAWLHASCTEWKNLFSFEIYGRDAKLHIEGLGGSYGVERLHFYKMLPEMGPPETTLWEYPRGDQSWAEETWEFLRDIGERRACVPGLADAQAVLRIVSAIYGREARCSTR
ncbi:MAG: Gfo/Idh/MocA family oxidoreductase [Chthoniobacteraceae bacterium]